MADEVSFQRTDDTLAPHHNPAMEGTRTWILRLDPAVLGDAHLRGQTYKQDPRAILPPGNSLTDETVTGLVVVQYGIVQLVS